MVAVIIGVVWGIYSLSSWMTRVGFAYTLDGEWTEVNPTTKAVDTYRFNLGRFSTGGDATWTPAGGGKPVSGTIRVTGSSKLTIAWTGGPTIYYDFEYSGRWSPWADTKLRLDFKSMEPPDAPMKPSPKLELVKK